MNLRLDWDRVDGGSIGAQAAPAHSCGDKDYRWCPVVGPLLEPYRAQRAAQSWSNGTLGFAPDLSSARCLESFATRDNLVWRDGKLAPEDAAKPAVATVKVALPYPLVSAKAAEVDGLRVEMSADGAAWQPPGRGLAGSYAWQARFTLTKSVDKLALEAVVQHNQRALPYLAPGRNVLTIGGGDLAGRRVAVSVAWCPGSRSRSLQKLADRDEELGKGHGATWAAQPTITRAVVDHLPATMTIDVPTPAGAEPVYPRMLWIKREVLDSGDLATGDAKAAAGARLVELPSPWTLANQPPVPRAKGPVKTIELPFDQRAIVAADGQTVASGPLRWPKRPDEQVVAWAWLLGKPTGALPPADQILTARIAFEVVDAHDKADMSVGAVTMARPYQPGQKYAFEALGGVVGSAIVKKADGPVPFNPAKPYAIDVTKAARALARDGGAGFALRILPNRAVDDGWTVRFTPRPDVAPKLVVEVPAG
ncbi:MAG: hypothetical protein HZB16_09695 [Armatimonadetes bacterium]|nr:hypothetical protein [Armatimonadota bacterium]